MTSELATAGAPAPDQKTRNRVETIILRDGRTLAYAMYGASLSTDRIPLFYFNGTPGSRLEGKLLDQPAQTLGITIIATDRPGFGRSSWQENRKLLDWPCDILELADHLKISTFGVMGLSGGGPYVLACLHAIPRERLVCATTVSGMYPPSLGTTGMMWQTRFMFSVSRWSTWALEKMFDLSMAKMLRDSADDPEKLRAQMEAQSKGLPQPEVDEECMKQILEDEVLHEAYIGSMREALSQSSKGAAWESWLFASDWGFRLEELDVSSLMVWHGALDVNVPIGMPDQFAEMLSGVEYKRMDEDGHLSLIVRHREQILSHVVRRLYFAA